MRKSHGRGVCRGTRETSGPTHVTRRTRTPLGRRLDPRGDRVRFGCRATNDRAARLESDGRRASCASCVPHFAMHVRPVRRRCPFETGCARNAEHEACGDSRCTRRSRSVPPNRQDPTVHRSAHRFEISSRPMHGEMPRCGLETFASSCRFGIDYTGVTRRQSEQLSPAGAHGARHDIRFVPRSIRRSLDEVLDEVLVEARDVVRDSDDDSDSDGDGDGDGNSHHDSDSDSDSESWHRIRACQPARHAVDQRLRAAFDARRRAVPIAARGSRRRPVDRPLGACTHRRIGASTHACPKGISSQARVSQARVRSRHHIRTLTKASETIAHT
ncbi:Uncharacterised protein [Burkholderia pseudomallei]|nr:Uncharacterised protein [Burkholderia pseudomallei]